MTLVPALTPRRLAGRSKVQGTSKSRQFWHRPRGSSLAPHFILRLLQKSPARALVCEDFFYLAGLAKRARVGNARRQEARGGEKITYRPLRRAGAFAVFATFDQCLQEGDAVSVVNNRCINGVNGGPGIGSRSSERDPGDVDYGSRWVQNRIEMVKGKKASLFHWDFNRSISLFAIIAI